MSRLSHPELPIFKVSARLNAYIWPFIDNMEFLIKAAQLILSLSILIVLHELGHFIPARIFKTRVEKFYLFFNPWFSLFKVKRGETEYGLGWLPLGGYVKISGMVDESMDTEQMNRPPEPWEFRAKPAWQRLIIMIGGVTVNVILGFLIYMMVLFVWGDNNLPLKNVHHGITVDSVMIKNGLMNGDKILSVENEVPEDLFEINRMILLRGARKIEVERNGEKKTVMLPEDIEYQMVGAGARMAIMPRIPMIVGEVVKDMPAAKGGLEVGDSIYAINGQEVVWYDQLQQSLSDHKSQEISVSLYRKNQQKEIKITVDDKGKIGIRPDADLKKHYNYVHKEFGFFGAIPAGISFGLQTLSDYVTSLKFLFTKEGASQISGFGGIGSMFSPTWDWHSFWMLTAFLSMVLAFMNILPIPALDGGHVMFLIWEMITGRPPKQKVLEYAQMVGMVLLLGLLLYANGNDLVRWFRG